MESALREVEPDDMDLAVSSEPQLMGTAGGLALARDRGLLGNEGPVLVVNGDCVLDLDLGPVLADHATGEYYVTLGLLPHPDPMRWSRVTVDGAGRVTDFLAPGISPSGQVPLHYPGVMVVSRRALARLTTEPGDIPRQLWTPALRQGRLGGTVVSGRWREIGTPTDYLAVALEHVHGRAVIHPSTQIAESALLRSAFIGRDAYVEASAVVDESVIIEGAVLRKGARVERSVVVGPVEVLGHEEVVEEFRIAPLPER